MGKTQKHKKTKRRGRDFDQVVRDTQTENYEKAMKQMTEFDEDKPGLGQFYCMACSRYFLSDELLKKHFDTKRHKRKMRQIQTEQPWTVQDALGMKIDNGKKDKTEQMRTISSEQSLFIKLEES